ncbi:heme o synthase [Paludisphaera rhizosphaerae]|uniref:heme o synthase n=1 Tax=Paludisphaera rhizosphaerae TaxID=2711216 RepID=UPI001F0ED91B|nr:heme o synthase [Paludisphaera rhizosphaerae]
MNNAAATMGDSALAAAPPSDVAALDEIGGRMSAFLTLTKPRIVIMELITVGVGFLLGARGSAHPATFLATLLGAGLVAGGAGALNMVLERERDAQMRRTKRRPLPSGRLEPIEAAAFGSLLAISGTLLLLFGAGATAAAVAFATLVLYVWVYTPLKTRTTLNTAVGAIPGALPPVIGWSAATGTLGIEAWTLFLIVFLWQFPHFLAIAWIAREDYDRGGMKMLPCVDPEGFMTGRQATLHALALIPAGLLPTVIGLAGAVYFVGALALGLFYLAASARFWADVNDATARKLLRASLLYLPAVLLLLVLNPLPA